MCYTLACLITNAQIVDFAVTPSPCVHCTEAVRAGAASLDAYPADPDAFLAESYSDRGLERAAMAASAEAFSRMVQPGLTAAAECGNMYAGTRLHWQLLPSSSTS